MTIPTPRTDAVTGRAIAAHYGPSKSSELYGCADGPFVYADHARQLETELAAANALLREAKKAIEYTLNDVVTERDGLVGEPLSFNDDNLLFSHVEKMHQAQAAIDAAMEGQP